MKLNKLVMAGILGVTAGVLCACAKNSTSETVESTDSADSSLSFADSADFLTQAWELNPSEEKPRIVGGVGETAVDGMVGEVSLDDLMIASTSLVVPESVLENVENAASIMHGMMANNLTASVMMLKDGVSAAEMAAEIEKQILGNQWICGQPEVYEIGYKGNYVVAAFGLEENVKGLFEGVSAAAGSMDGTMNGIIEMEF